jgi:hypothetical protein
LIARPLRQVNQAIIHAVSGGQMRNAASKRARDPSRDRHPDG